jgi:hypothetical protein
MTPYYLYTNGKLKKVERQLPVEDNYKTSRYPEADYNHDKRLFEMYLDKLPDIEVSPELKKLWKEGQHLQEGVDFKLSTWVPPIPETYEDYQMALHDSKHELSSPPRTIAIPIPAPEKGRELITCENCEGSGYPYEDEKDRKCVCCKGSGKIAVPAPEKEESQDDLWKEIKNKLLLANTLDPEWAESFKKEFQITRIKQ